MKLSHLVGVIGAAIIVAVVCAYGQNIKGEGDMRRRVAECRIIGPVADDCVQLVPDIEECHFEDCSDIKGPVGFWRNDGTLRLVQVPGIVTRRQP